MSSSRKDASRRLFDVAEEQQGFFTTKQARAAGFAENTNPYPVQIGNWIREYRGIYRLALFPASDRPDLVLWSPWSRNRQEVIEGVFSDQRALSLHELSDLNPAKLHMTAPKRFRRNSEIPGILVLHHRDLPESDVQIGPGYKYTRPLQTILDLIETGAIEPAYTVHALRQAVERGLITHEQLQDAALSEAARKVVVEALGQAA